jgi:uncharacterized protein YndB with AHSA1/START domain
MKEALMKKQAVIHYTFVIERSYAATPEQVFAALSDPAKRRRWLLEGQNHEVESFEIDFRVGGHERGVLRFGPKTPFPGTLFTRDGDFRDIIPNERVVSASAMSIGDKRISVSLETFELLPTEKGTDLIFTHQAAFFEGADGPEMREGGWRKLLEKLDAEIAH